jgi:uncharacterized repeat protein (TIGR03803 family)
VLYKFGTNLGDPIDDNDGASPAVVAQGRDGNLYSTSYGGGANGYGTVYKVTPAGTLTVLYSFDGTHGQNPFSGVTLATDGNFYGTTYVSTSGHGTVFKITPSGTLSVLYTFTGGADGGNPQAPPIQGTDGNLYGTTTSVYSPTPYGTVYKLTLAGTITTLHHFANTDGATPSAPLVQGADGNFYGTTSAGGTSGNGTVFKITPSGKLTVLYNFDGTHGWLPLASLIQASNGKFYGTTRYGGTIDRGVIYQITSAGTYTVLHNFDPTYGAALQVALVQATDGNLYGDAINGGTNNAGTLFRISPTGSNFSVLYNYDPTTDGEPICPLLQNTNGTFYGHTENGGTSHQGVFYSFNVSLGPFVSLLATSGKVGKSVEILGQKFTGTTVVSFAGTSATFSVVSDTYLTATVPSGAKTGSVKVTTPGGTLTSNKIFRVTPVILSFSPTSGKVDTSVVITGNSLTQTTRVTFGGVKATTFFAKSDTQVAATVPTGAVTGKIGITTLGGTATSSGTFTVMP